MRQLIKFTTRNRKNKFLLVLRKYHNFLSNKKVISPKLFFGDFNNNLITDAIYLEN